MHFRRFLIRFYHFNSTIVRSLSNLTQRDNHKRKYFHRYIIEQMQQVEGVTEDLKAADQMAWVEAMNSVRSRVEEIILRGMIYGEDAA